MVSKERHSFDLVSCWNFISSYIDSVDQAISFAELCDWEAIDEPDLYETYAPRGQLPFNEYIPWFVHDHRFVIATWSLFNLPVKKDILNTMTCNEAWMNGVSEPLLVEFLSDQFGDNPMGKKRYDEDIHAWVWGEGTKEKPNKRTLLRAGILGDDMAKVSFIRMFMI